MAQVTSQELQEFLTGNGVTNVIATIEPLGNEGPLNEYTFWEEQGAAIACVTGPFCFFWCCAAKANQAVKMREMKKRSWVLTDTSLIQIQRESEGCCCPSGCWTTPDLVRYFPLLQITDVTSDDKGRGCCKCVQIDSLRADCVTGLGTINFVGAPKQELMSFRDTVLSARDAAKGHARALVGDGDAGFVVGAPVEGHAPAQQKM